MKGKKVLLVIYEQLIMIQREIVGITTTSITTLCTLRNDKHNEI